MPFLLLIFEREDRTRWSAAQAREAAAAMTQFTDELRERGLYLASTPLRPSAEGARVESRAGRRIVVDGPFAETKEIVGGFILVDCRTRDEAIALASECPAAAWSTIEVRETATSCAGDLDDAPPSPRRDATSTPEPTPRSA